MNDELFVVEALSHASCRTIWNSEPLGAEEACDLADRIRDQSLMCPDGFDWPVGSFQVAVRCYRPDDE